jgi:hypothetical protein
MSVLILCKTFLEIVKIVLLWKSMDPRDHEHIMDNDLAARETKECQTLIKFCALSSTISYALETMVQHRTLIGQLQDGIYVFRSHIEDLQRRLDQQEETRVQMSSSISTIISSEAPIAPIPDLNEPLAKDLSK